VVATVVFVPFFPSLLAIEVGLVAMVGVVVVVAGRGGGDPVGDEVEADLCKEKRDVCVCVCA
jgi:hypothetical protein